MLRPGRLIPQAVEAALRLAERPSARDPEALLASLDIAADHNARPALECLISSCFEEADLSAFGRAALRWDVRQRLASLHRLAAEEAADPSIGDEKLETVFITGMPRSGSSFLHRLLAADPSFRAPRAYETVTPYPDPRGPDRRAARMNRQLRQFAWLAPALASLHPLDSTMPQECSEITAHVFQSLRFEMMYAIPRYKAWLAGVGHHEAYRFHRRFLRHLQHGRRPATWLLKSPDHVFALDALLAAYPGARVIALHRDPRHVIASVCRLNEVIRAPFTRRIDRHAIGRQNLEDWARGAAILIAELQRPSQSAGRVLHLRYRDLIARPLDTARRIYGHFEWPMSPAAEAGIRHQLAAAPNGGYGANRYDPAEYGIGEADLRRFAEYADLFALPNEKAPRGHGPLGAGWARVPLPRLTSR